MRAVHHALVLNLHQPALNLEDLLEHKPWEAREILYAIDRIPRSLWEYEGLARVHLSLSGTLLETLSSPEFQERVYGIVDCGSLLWQLQNRSLFEILATAYYHPVLPLIPEADREEQLLRWQAIARHLFWREAFAGFWPPEMGFAMEMIPLLRRHGYRYVLVDSEHVEPLTPMRWEDLRYRPHTARFAGEEIVVVVRDRELSNAQLSGMEYEWFAHEAQERTKGCDYPPLVTTCTDGDNGGWFRNSSPQANFWGVFYRPLLEDAKRGGPVQPAFLGEYIDQFGAHGEVKVNTGAWNTGWHDGKGFVQWTGSEAQREALRRVAEISRAVHDTKWRAGETGAADPSLHGGIEQALWHVLRAETSCNFFWGEAWVERCHRDLDEASASLEAVQARLPQRP